ncbi:hypothetical protein MNBD_PLANCTO02-570 [hydrothermal vent metagenome]|uniref:Uncharacterized protein n=1 Tax=hydrothermal vent metagenome TaxID=652676 RepID=A0A3B1E089_9ZZZZ
MSLTLISYTVDSNMTGKIIESSVVGGTENAGNFLWRNPATNNTNVNTDKTRLFPELMYGCFTGLIHTMLGHFQFQWRDINHLPTTDTDHIHQPYEAAHGQVVQPFPIANGMPLLSP